MSDFRYIGKENNQYLISDGIRTKYLTSREFTEWSRQLKSYSSKWAFIADCYFA